MSDNTNKTDGANEIDKAYEMNDPFHDNEVNESKMSHQVRTLDITDVAQVIAVHGDMVYRILRLRLKEQADVEDIYQEVFLRLMQGRPQITDAEHLRAWLCRVAINLSHDFYRSAWQQRTFPLTTADAMTMEDPEESSIVKAVSALPNNMRLAVHLHYYEGYSAVEIATIIGRKENSVYSDLNRARKKLRKLLEE